jgi:DNA-binding transcriptional ArsR family regulator
MSTKPDSIPDALILAAVARAARHWPRDGEVSKGDIYDHLAIPSRSGPARHVHRRLAALEAAGMVERSRRNGVVVFSLSSVGRRGVERARRSGEVVLPESPQHREWSRARSLAGQEIERFRFEFRTYLLNAIGLLSAEPPAASDAFFELAEPLSFQCRRLGSATYCLDEWAEPDDQTPDVDDCLQPAERDLPRKRRIQLYSMRNGRRSTWLWSRRA